MHLAILSGGNGWHVRDLQRAATLQGHTASLRRFPPRAGRGRHAHDSLATADAVIVRTMPPGSLEQVVFRMDVLHRLQARGVAVLNPPRALETCVDKYLASARLEAAGLPVPPTVVCQDADAALEAFAQLGGDVVVKPLFGSEGRGMVRVSDPELAWRTFRTLERTAARALPAAVHPPPRLGPARVRARRPACWRRCGGTPTATTGGPTSPRAAGPRRSTPTAEEERWPWRRPRRSGAAVGGRRSAAGAGRRVVRAGGQRRARLAGAGAGNAS